MTRLPGCPIFLFPFLKLPLSLPDVIPTLERKPMSWREANAIKFDFEDLVKELDAFEQDIKTLQDRIDQFITDARQDPEESGQLVEAVASGGKIVVGS